MSFHDDLEAVQEMGRLACEYVAEGKLGKAKSLLAKLRRSHFISESERAIAVTEALLLLKKGDFLKAKQRVLQSMGYLWGIEDGLIIISFSNPPVNNDTFLYHIEILGGQATVGGFCRFTASHVGTFDVLANSKDEALTYIEEVARFAESHKKKILRISQHPLPKEEYRNRGVIRTYPFTKQ